MVCFHKNYLVGLIEDSCRALVSSAPGRSRQTGELGCMTRALTDCILNGPDWEFCAINPH